MREPRRHVGSAVELSAEGALQPSRRQLAAIFHILVHRREHYTISPANPPPSIRRAILSCGFAVAQENAENDN